MRLCDLSDSQLHTICDFTSEEFEAYISELITKFFPSVTTGSDEYEKLLKAYASSLWIEKIYRENAIFQQGFRPVYTKTGLIRDLINDLYYVEDSLIIH